ncbi:hypothetical protein VNI00_014052 [Paramarasmius palmivorus]|uniref:Uncharacterized protein n=1 Tax=Paramarasmius palmivorus TaxID=297713 RepID=A0AAW0BUE7_9AGAR
MALLSFLRLSLLLSTISFAAADGNFNSTNALWTGWSMLTRQQGFLTTNDSSQLFQTGLVQKAFLKLIRQYPGDPYRGTYQTYYPSLVNSAVYTVSGVEKALTYTLDRLAVGPSMLNMASNTQDEKYRDAFDALHQSIDQQPRNTQGGLWWWNRYPEWSIIDSMYAFGPFYIPYALYHEPDNTTNVVGDVALQFDLLWEHCHCNKTGLLRHGYDASKKASWADQETGQSPHVFGRAMALYTAGLVDTLEYIAMSKGNLPSEVLDKWSNMQSKFKSIGDALLKNAEGSSGGWWQVMDEPSKVGNYIESSATALFVYSLFKGNRYGYFRDGAEVAANSTYEESVYMEAASKAYRYLEETFVVKNPNGTIEFNGTVAGCGLDSGSSYEYYVGQPIEYNSPIGNSAFMLASLEYERFNNKTSDTPWAPL